MKKKGFTLIELLAVIVILAIIALIVTPKIQDIIKSAREAAFKRSIEGVLEAAKYYQIETSNYETVTFTCDGTTCEDEDGHKLVFNGEVPKSGTVTASETEVVAVNLCNNSYCGSGSKDSLVINTGGAPVETCDIGINAIYLFDYLDETNEVRYHTYRVPCTGKYKLETWGAQGGDADGSNIGGYGGYSVGEFELGKNDTIYINVGGQGVKTTTGPIAGGYNGGGPGSAQQCREYTGRNAASGGGATSISRISKPLNEYEEATDKDKLIIVASGGGGGYNQSNYIYGRGGSGGGYVGVSGSHNNTGSTYAQYSQGGSQTSGGLCGDSYDNLAGRSEIFINWLSGKFAQGGEAADYECGDGGGGGGGYYGGGGSLQTAGGGGSGYIALLTNAKMVCYGCSADKVNSATYTESTSCSELIPYANCAKKGNGYARITYLGN